MVGTKYLAGLNLTLVLFSLFAICRFISCYLPQMLLFRQSSVLKILIDVVMPDLRMKSNYFKEIYILLRMIMVIRRSLIG